MAVSSESPLDEERYPFSSGLLPTESFVSPEPSSITIDKIPATYHHDGDFTVRSDKGSTLLKMPSSSSSWTSKRSMISTSVFTSAAVFAKSPPNGSLVFYDKYKSHLFTFRRHSIRLPASFYLLSKGGERCVEIKVKWSLARLHAETHFTTAGGREMVLSVRARSLKNDILDINYQGKKVATIHQKPGERLVSGRRTQEYEAELAPYADVALISAIVVMFDTYLSPPHSSANGWGNFASGFAVGAAAGGGGG